MNYRHTFTQTEREILDVIAELRYKETSGNTKDRQQDTTFTEFEINRRGVYSEYVVSKYLNLHFNFDCNYRIDFGPDLVSRNGNSIDVKCTHYENGGIAAVPWSDNKDADVFIGCYAPIDLKFCEIFGYIMRDDLIKPSRLRSNGKTEYYLAKRNEIKLFNEQRH